MNKSIISATIACLLSIGLTTKAQTFLTIEDANDVGNLEYVLTLDQQFSWGAIWHPELVSLENSFDYRFEMNLGTKDGDGADGIVFALQPVSTSVGAAGEGMGFQNVQPSLFVEFDTWQNWNRNDPADDHAAIFRDGIVDHGSWQELDGPVTFPNWEDGQYHPVRIKWDAPTETFSVHFDCEPILSYTGDVINDIFDGNPWVYWGFTSATGGNTNVQSVRVPNDDILRDTIPDYTICEGEAVEFLNVVNGNWTWSEADGGNTSITSGINTGAPTVAPLSTTEYIGIVTDECDSWTEHVLVIVQDCNPPPCQITTSNTAICAGGSATLVATANVDYEWVGENGTVLVGSSPVVSPTATTTYTVRSSDNSGSTCEATQTVSVESFDVEASSNPVCLGEAARLTVIPAENYLSFEWSTGSSSTEITVTSTNDYQITVTAQLNDLQCISAANINAAFHQLPEADAGEDVTICAGTTTVLTATGGEAYEWSSTPSGASGFSNAITVGPAQTTSYNVTVTDQNGCSDQDQVMVIITPYDDPTITPAGPYCTADETVFMTAATNGGTWSGPGITDAATGAFDPGTLTPGNHTINYQVGTRCPATDNQLITILGFPDPTITPIGPYCDFDSAVELTAVDPGGKWTLNGNALTEPKVTPSELGAGRYSIYYAFDGACAIADDLEFDIHPSVSPKLTAITDLCLDHSPVALEADISNGTWSGTGVMGSTFDPTIAGTGVHEITYDIQTECGFPERLNITVLPLPDPTISPVGIQCIESIPVQLEASTAGGTWTGMGVINPTSGLFTPSQAKVGDHLITYTVTLEGCEASDSTIISVRQNSVDIGPDTTMCTRAGENLVLDPGQYTIYQWSDGSNDPTLVANYDDDFSVTVWDENGCMATDEMVLTDYCACEVWFPNAFTPNNDGLNDEFKVVGTAPLGLDVYILNRWGDLLFHGQSLDDTWDGQVRGKQHDEKVDVYVVKLVCPDADPVFGRISIAK